MHFYFPYAVCICIRSDAASSLRRCLLTVVLLQEKMDSKNQISMTGTQNPQQQDITDAQTSANHLPAHGHNASSQRDVSTNPDLVLHYSHEHEHQHLHHHKMSLEGRDDEVVYSHGHDVEKSNVPDQNAQDSHHQAYHTDRKTPSKPTIVQHDAEKGIVSPASLSQEEEDPRSHKVSGFYSKWKVFFHAAFLALMTGYVVFNGPLPSCESNYILWQVVDSSPYPS